MPGLCPAPLAAGLHPNGTPMNTRRLSAALLLTIFLAASLPARAEDARGVVRVALYAGAGTSGKGPKMLEESLSAGGQFEVKPITPEEIRAGRLKEFQVLIFPGGLSSTQGIALGEDGREV